MRGYAICTEQRSGSTLLCRLLESTGALGHPTEYFNVHTMRNGKRIADYPEEPEGQLGAILQLGATPNGVYGFKLFSAEVPAARSVRWAERLPSLSFVHLVRHDILAQSISHIRARQTERWVAHYPERAEPFYDKTLINNELARLAAAHAQWRFFFARNGLPVLNLSYEQLAQAPQAAVDAVARLIGLDGAHQIDLGQLANLTIQRDALNEEWRARFIAESRDLNAFP